MLYFAYGSNLLTRRLRERAPSAQPRCVALLRGHDLRFHKRARDGSSKCDAWKTDDDSDSVHGMLFDIDDADWVSLDRAESRGVGYERMSVEVEPRDGSRLLISAYFARDDHIDSRLKPYTWYRDLVVAGAREHDLPAAYIVRIENEPAVPDTNLEREAAMRGLLDADP